MPSELSRDQLSHLAKLGAKVRLAEIKQERATLNAMLNGGPNGARPKQSTSPEPVRRRSRRRVTWTADQRRAVSKRMKKYCTKPLRGSYSTHQCDIAA